MHAIDQVMSAFVRGVRTRHMHARIRSGHVTETAAEYWTAVSDELTLFRARAVWWAQLAADAATGLRPAALGAPAVDRHPAEPIEPVEHNRDSPPHRIAEYRIPLRAG